ncbi:MAG: electron transport complex subunit RsxC [Clostridiales bacterium]|nr:electron transport complex subunit RsxC [Clostridiales bacterium]
MSKFSFRGGIHPLHDTHEGKDLTRNKPVRAYASKIVTIPMDMHIGAPSNPIVKKGEQVLLGQVIAEAVGGIGIPVHASVSGTVTDVSAKIMMRKVPSMCITIENNGLDEWIPLNPLGSVESADSTKIIQAIKAAGICGMGGACFPTHIKMSPPPDKQVDIIILNGAECETYLTADFRLMLEQPQKVVDGLRIAMRAMNVKRGLIGIEDNKPEAIDAIKKAAAGRDDIEVCTLKTKYPQGGEKQLIKALINKEVPAGGLPADAGAVVLNVATAAAIRDAVVEGMPLINRITTVTGKVKEPDNLLLPIGTLVNEAVEACGGYSQEPGKIFFGGSMTGICAPNEEASVTKANNGLVVFNEKEAIIPPEDNCIRCSRCIYACPVYLNPYAMKKAFDMDKMDVLENKLNVKECILCGACSYICPSHQYLTPAFKDAKDIIAARRVSK